MGVAVGCGVDKRPAMTPLSCRCRYPWLQARAALRTPQTTDYDRVAWWNVRIPSLAGSRMSRRCETTSPGAGVAPSGVTPASRVHSVGRTHLRVLVRQSTPGRRGSSCKSDRAFVANWLAIPTVPISVVSLARDSESVRYVHMARRTKVGDISIQCDQLHGVESTTQSPSNGRLCGCDCAFVFCSP